jgi:type I restriction enzyme S subunit
VFNNSLRDGKSISYRQASDLILYVPKIEEQQKIAASLISIDELIALQIERLDALKNHKKGLMQKLFPPSAEAGA